MLIAIYGNRRQTQYADTLKNLFAMLAMSDVDMLMHSKLYRHLTADLGLSLPGVAPIVNDEFPADADLVLSIGGDGTFLRTAAWTGCAQTPILGINTGTLGYLAAVNLDHAEGLVDDIINANYTIESRALLHIETPRLSVWPFALNEVVVSKDDHASIVQVEAHINGRKLADYRADGLIVSTPTGSTAYNLSVGGPIVQPVAPVWVVSPIAAHSLGMRPLIIDNDSELTLAVTGRSPNFRLSVDGRSTLLPAGSVITLRRAPYVVRIVQREADRFPAVLHNKLYFN